MTGTDCARPTPCPTETCAGIASFVGPMSPRTGHKLSPQRKEHRAYLCTQPASPTAIKLPPLKGSVKTRRSVQLIARSLPCSRSCVRTLTTTWCQRHPVRDTCPQCRVRRDRACILGFTTRYQTAGGGYCAASPENPIKRRSVIFGHASSQRAQTPGVTCVPNIGQEPPDQKRGRGGAFSPRRFLEHDSKRLGLGHCGMPLPELIAGASQWLT